MKFTKMQGCGNDYVYVNGLEEQVDCPEEMARTMSDRHFGIGSDGLIIIRSSKIADFRMEMYNLDGSRGEMCGNGIRCVGKYVYDHGLTSKNELQIETGAGIKKLSLIIENGKVKAVTVDMGVPILKPEDIPVNLGKEGAESVVSVPLEVEESCYEVTCVSMGNPHAVTFVEKTEGLPLEKIGPAFERHPAFPNRVNTEFVEVLNRNVIRMRVWERGSGETMACGTGACASVIAGILNGKTEDEVLVHLLGGDLRIRYDRGSGHVFMTGEAVSVFEGEIFL